MPTVATTAPGLLERLGAAAHLDADRLRQVSDALLDAREAVIEVLDGREVRR